MNPDGSESGLTADESTLCQRVLQTLWEQRVLASSRLHAYMGASKERVRTAVDGLVRSSRVRMFHLRDHVIFLLPNPKFAACDCDGTCGEQAHLLSDPVVRDLWSWMRDRSPCDSAGLREYGRSRGMGKSVIYHHLNRLLELDLVRRIPTPHGDRRLGWYEVGDPLPSAQAILGLKRSNVGPIDKALSIEEDS